MPRGPQGTGILPEHVPPHQPPEAPRSRESGRRAPHHTARMLTLRPGVRSSVTNSQLQLLLSSAASSPGRLASGRGGGGGRETQP